MYTYTLAGDFVFIFAEHINLLSVESVIKQEINLFISRDLYHFIFKSFNYDSVITVGSVIRQVLFETRIILHNKLNIHTRVSAVESRSLIGSQESHGAADWLTLICC